MHAFNHESTQFFHNGDFSGDVSIQPAGQPEIKVPMEALVALVAKWKRDELINKIEQASDEEILLHMTQGII